MVYEQYEGESNDARASLDRAKMLYSGENTNNDVRIFDQKRSNFTQSTTLKLKRAGRTENTKSSQFKPQ